METDKDQIVTMLADTVSEILKCLFTPNEYIHNMLAIACLFIARCAEMSAVGREEFLRRFAAILQTLPPIDEAVPT